MIVVDVEASGLDPKKHAIVSIGAVDFSRPERQFYVECRIWEGAQSQPEALAVNGFTVEQITDPGRIPAHEAIAQFVAFCRETEERTLAGQNTSFDRDFLQEAADRHGVDFRFGYRTLDLHSVAWAHMVRAGYPIPLRGGRTALSLGTILTYCGMPEEPKPHNALTGAKVETEAFSRLMQGKSFLEEFARYPLFPAAEQGSLL